jgi:hypothetical protein
MEALAPRDRDTIAALIVVARRLGAPCAYWAEGRFWFPLSEGWALAISPDSAGRFRLAACADGREVATMWSRSGDWHRLADLVPTLLTAARAIAG